MGRKKDNIYLDKDGNVQAIIIPQKRVIRWPGGVVFKGNSFVMDENNLTNELVDYFLNPDSQELKRRRKTNWL